MDDTDKQNDVSGSGTRTKNKIHPNDQESDQKQNDGEKQLKDYPETRINFWFFIENMFFLTFRNF